MEILKLTIPDEQIEKVISKFREHLDNANEEILTTEEVSKLTGISVARINKYCLLGAIPHTKKEGVKTKLFLKSQVQDIEANKLKYK